MNRRSKDLTGQRFGRLVVIEPMPLANNGNAMFKAKCDCGAIVVKRGSHLRLGSVKSCGCLHDTHAIGKQYGKTHGHAIAGQRSPTYESWTAMWQRCTRNKHPDFHRYGGRGITVCERWKSFENFLSDMGERPPGKNLERRNNDEGYCKDNCKWATAKEQSRNRASNRLLCHHGQIRCVSEWAEVLGIKKSTLNERLRRGWSIRRALQ